MSIGMAIAELAEQVRGDTLQFLEAAEPDWLTYSPPGTSNHILWHAGHVLWVQDLLCVRLLADQGSLPAGWEETFSMNCRPVRETKEWPRRGEMWELLATQLRSILELLHATEDARFLAVVDSSRGPATVMERVIHGIHDEAKHSGEMYLLMKLCRAGSSRVQAPDNGG